MPQPRSSLPTDGVLPRKVNGSLRMPPHDNNAEQSVLGGIFWDAQQLDAACEFVRPDDFYDGRHRRIFQAMMALHANDRPVDRAMVSNWLLDRGELDAIGGSRYLVELSRDTPSPALTAYYAEIVRDCAVRRRLITACQTTIDVAHQPDDLALNDILDGAETRVFEIAHSLKGMDKLPSMGDTLSQALDHLGKLSEIEGAVTGTSTGLTDFDEMTAGLQKGDLVIVAGRPSMGKTTLAMNFVEHVAVQLQQPALVFSMEMNRIQLTLRLMSSVGRLNQQTLRRGKFNPEELESLTRAVDILEKTTILIDDTPGLGPAELRARARRHMRDVGSLGIVMVDYIQLMQVPGNKENRATEVAQISRALKGLARELDVPVVALSQLNRSLEARSDKRPMMSDLRESGGLEQDADVIVFIYRDEVYDKESPHKGIAELIIGKQRNGPIGIVKTKFFGEFNRFDNLTANDYADEDF